MLLSAIAFWIGLKTKHREDDDFAAALRELNVVAGQKPLALHERQRNVARGNNGIVFMVGRGQIKQNLFGRLKMLLMG